MALADRVPYYVDRLLEAMPPLDASHLFLDTVEGRGVRLTNVIVTADPIEPPEQPPTLWTWSAEEPLRDAIIASTLAYLEACKPSLVVCVPYASAAEADAPRDIQAPGCR